MNDHEVIRLALEELTRIEYLKMNLEHEVEQAFNRLEDKA